MSEVDPSYHKLLVVRLLLSMVVCHQPYNGRCLGCVEEGVLGATGMGCGLHTCSSFHFVGSVEAFPEERGIVDIGEAVEDNPNVKGLAVHRLVVYKDPQYNEAAWEEEEEVVDNRDWVGECQDKKDSLQTDYRLVHMSHWHSAPYPVLQLCNWGDKEVWVDLHKTSHLDHTLNMMCSELRRLLPSPRLPASFFQSPENNSRLPSLPAPPPASGGPAPPLPGNIRHHPRLCARQTWN